jgi:hypothetical protein
MLTIGSTPPIVSTATAMLSRPPATGIVSINLVSINLVRTAAVTPRCRALVTEGDNRARMSQASRAPIPRGWRPCRKQSGWHADCPVRRARLPRPECAFLQWRSRAACCLAGLREQREREAALGGVDVELARKWGEPRVLGAALHAQALVKGHQDGEAPLREALQILEGLARQAGARVVVALGAMLRRYPSASAGAPLRSGLWPFTRTTLRFS